MYGPYSNQDYLTFMSISLFHMSEIVKKLLEDNYGPNFVVLNEPQIQPVNQQSVNNQQHFNPTTANPIIPTNKQSKKKSQNSNNMPILN